MRIHMGYSPRMHPPQSSKASLRTDVPTMPLPILLLLLYVLSKEPRNAVALFDVPQE